MAVLAFSLRYSDKNVIEDAEICPSVLCIQLLGNFPLFSALFSAVKHSLGKGPTGRGFFACDDRDSKEPRVSYTTRIN